MEAAVIVPLSVTIISLLLGFCFYTHQINWYKGAAYEAAEKGIESGGDSCAAAQQRMDSRTEEIPMRFGSETTEVSSGLNVSVSFRGSVLEDVFGDLFGFEGEALLLKTDPVKIKRLEFLIKQ